MNTKTEPDPTELSETIKLGIDARAKLHCKFPHISRYGHWWKGATWKHIRQEAPDWVIERLGVFIRLTKPVETEEMKLTPGWRQIV